MLRQSLQQKLLQKLSPQQIQLMKLLQLPTQALEQRIKEEMEANPALEDDAETNEEEDVPSDYEEESTEPGSEEEDGREADDFSIADYLNEDDDPEYKYQVKNTGPDEDDKREIPFSGGLSFQEQLESQLGMQDLDEHQYMLGLYLIGNIDDDGYLRRDIPSIVDDIAFSQNIKT